MKKASPALAGFKTFILRGNVIDLAVGVVIGAAFNSVVNTLVKGLLTPFIGAVLKTPDFSGLSFSINGSQFLYGDFINALISFLLTAAAIYFFIILPINSLHASKKTEPSAPTKKLCPECKSEIPVEAKRCAFCTQAI